MADDPLLCKAGPFGGDRLSGSATSLLQTGLDRYFGHFDMGRTAMSTPAGTGANLSGSAWSAPPSAFTPAVFSTAGQQPTGPATLARTAEGVKVVRITAAEFKIFTGKYTPNREVARILCDDTSGLLWFHNLNRSSLRLCHFLAQMAHESTRFSQLRELLGYSTPERIVEVFGPGHSAKVTLEEAKDLVNNAAALAERVYGLGNPTKAKEFNHTVKGEGLKYRGRGLVHLTGKANYEKMGNHPDIQLPLVAQPELAEEPLNALRIAVCFWKSRNLDALADVDDIVTITKRINGGDNGLSDRKGLLKTAKSLWLDRAPE